MSRYRPRVISQATRAILADIHRENDRQRQIDRGLGYKAFVREKQDRVGLGAAGAPLHVGPALEAVKLGDEWAA